MSKSRTAAPAFPRQKFITARLRVHSLHVENPPQAGWHPTTLQRPGHALLHSCAPGADCSFLTLTLTLLPMCLGHVTHTTATNAAPKRPYKQAARASYHASSELCPPASRCCCVTCVQLWPKRASSPTAVSIAKCRCMVCYELCDPG